MKSIDHIAAEAAEIVLTENLLSKAEGEDSLAALAWALGEGIEYGEGLSQLVGRAIELDRAQREEEIALAKSLKRALKRFDARKDGGEDDLVYAAREAVRYLSRGDA